MRRHAESGLTLTEMVVVIVLAAMVMTGVVAFYLNSQATWLDGATQAITQREGTLVLTAISARARRATNAHVTGTQLNLSMPPPESTWVYRWNQGGDSLIYEGPSVVSSRAMLTSPVEAFAVRVDGHLVVVDSLRLRSANGQHITLTTSAAVINWTGP